MSGEDSESIKDDGEDLWIDERARQVPKKQVEEDEIEGEEDGEEEEAGEAFREQPACVECSGSRRARLTFVSTADLVI